MSAAGHTSEAISVVPWFFPTMEITTVESSNDKLETYLLIMYTHGV